MISMLWEPLHSVDQQEDYIYQMTKVAFQMYSAIFVLNLMEMDGGQEGGGAGTATHSC